MFELFKKLLVAGLNSNDPGRKLMMIGQVSSTLGRMVLAACEKDYLASLSVGGRNFLAEKTLETVNEVHGGKIKKYEDLTLVIDDLMVTGFLLLAEEIGPKNGLDHQVVLLGLMGYISDNSESISPIVLNKAMAYLDTWLPSN